MNGIFCEEKELIDLRFEARPLRLPYGRKLVTTGSGTVASKVRGRGVDFSEVRKYEPGDDSRNIDWRVTARRGRVHTKLFTEERERPVYFVIDQTKSMFFGTQKAFKSVVAARVCTQMAWGAQAFKDRIGSIIFSESEHVELSAKAGKRGVLALIRYLAKFNKALAESPSAASSDNGGLCKALERLCKVSPKGGIVVIASDFSEDLGECKKWISALCKHNDLIGIHIYDKLEKTLPLGSYAFSNRRDTLSLDISKKNQESFALEFNRRKDEVSELFKEAKGRYFALATHDNLSDFMMAKFALRARGMR